MSDIIHVIYCSASSSKFSREDLTILLEKARNKNRQLGITGMLLHTDGSFFQVLEGPEENVERLMDSISKDKRHYDVTLIIKESIARRSFEDWTMGFATLPPGDVDKIIGANDFFVAGKSYSDLDHGRTKKLLKAFREGRWRTRLSDVDVPQMAYAYNRIPEEIKRDDYNFSFAFQPIVNVNHGMVFSYEALIRGINNESAGEVFKRIDEKDKYTFDEMCRKRAVYTAAKLGINTKLNVNFLPMSVAASKTAISSILNAAVNCGLKPDQIVLEVLESEIISDVKAFSDLLDIWRPTGMILAIDDFGSGHAGLNLLADFQPNILKLDMELIRNVDTQGPRQAIVRGVIRTCEDLGIDIIAEGVESVAEYNWLCGEGIELFQGNLLAEAEFETLRGAVKLPASQ